MSAETVERIGGSAATWDGVTLRPEERPFERIFSLEATAALVDPEAVYEDAVLPDHAGANISNVLRPSRRASHGPMIEARA